jgi:hypothetical protein
MIKDHNVSFEIQVAMSGTEYKKWSTEDRRLKKMLDPFKKVKS